MPRKQSRKGRRKRGKQNRIGLEEVVRLENSQGEYVLKIATNEYNQKQSEIAGKTAKVDAGNKRVFVMLN